MFKFLKDKLKKVVSKFSKEVKEEKKEEIKEEVKEKPKEEIKEKKPEIKELKKKEIPEKKKEIKEEEKREEIEGVKITYFVHGTTTDNEKGTASGQSNIGLSDLGKRQCVELKRLIKDNRFDVVFSSDLKRAVDSANLTFEEDIIHDKRLREINYGDLTQFPDKKINYSEHIETTFPNGESLKDVEKRVTDFLNYLFDNYEGKHVAIVAHKAPQLALDVLLKGKTWEQAIKEDWRLKGKWQPGWNYELKKKIEKPIEEISEKKGFFERIKDKITKTVISEKKFNEFFDELEIVLMENNVAFEVIQKIKEDLSKEIVEKPLSKGKVEDIIKENLKKSISELFVENIDMLSKLREKKPFVICFVGINGSGKTTSIAKIASYLMKNKLSVVLAASDTFRAASIEQLQEHADKLNVKMIKHSYGSDPAAVAFDAIKYASAKNIDAVLIDTAGRMHSNVNLMDELKKVIRVSKPDLKIFVGESITGNDCVEQARIFNESIDIDGIILTKADVDEKGGAAISVSYITGKPIMFLGYGQGYDDLKEFDKEIVVSGLGLD